jgi:hypothetical protein
MQLEFPHIILHRCLGDISGRNTSATFWKTAILGHFDGDSDVVVRVDDNVILIILCNEL